MRAPDSAYMRASDAFSWHMERDPVLRSTVVVVAWLDRAPDWDMLAARIDRMTRFIPTARQRVIESPFPLVTPRWAYDPHFDFDWHLRRVTAPAPHTRDAVLQLARRSAMDTFDRWPGPPRGTLSSQPGPRPGPRRTRCRWPPGCSARST